MNGISMMAKEEGGLIAQESTPNFVVGPHGEALSPTPSSMSASANVFKMPTAVYFIIGNEFCERFSFYGMKTILPPYLQLYLGFSEEAAIATIHTFIFFAYAVTLFGGIVSDSYLGKYKTILFLSLVYCIGNVVMSITSIPDMTGTPPHWWGMALGLLLIGIGTGGIKPCVSSFGGDHFRPSQSAQIALYFSMFYFAINAGSLLSMAITPILRDDIHCFGSQSCYPLAFGVPAVLMLLALLIFVAGSRLYRKVPPTDNIIVQVFKVILFSTKMYVQKLVIRSGSSTQAAYLPIEENNLEATTEQAAAHRPFFAMARLKYPSMLVDDIEVLLKVLKMLAPVIFFWSVYDQQSSRWTYQGYTMDSKVDLFGFSFHVKAEQMQIWNAIFMLLMIPFFEKVVYPTFRRFKVPFRPLARMITGMCLCALTCMLVAALQWRIDRSVLVPDTDHPGAMKCIDNCVSIMAQIPQYIFLTMAEVLVSITGLEFAYSQAPMSMKSVCSAFWLLTVAFGNLIVILLTWLDLFGRLDTGHTNVWNNLLYASLLLLGIVLMAIGSRSYSYIEDTYRDRKFQQVAESSFVHQADEEFHA